MHMKKILPLLLALVLVGCDCPYLDGKYGESDHDYYVRTGYDRLTANKLPGLWQCYYPMIVGNVELKEVRIFSNGKADIIFEKLGGSDYYAETFKWRYDGRYLSFSGNTNYQFQITGYLFPELYLRDSRGKYTWAYRRTEDCIK
jgi:hypothetical protein